jgi:hypothetical protein
MQNKILELAKSYKEELLRKNEMEYAIKKPGIGEDYYAHIAGIDSVCDGIADCIRIGYKCPDVESEMKSYIAERGINFVEDSVDYKFCLEKFIQATYEACIDKLKIYKGEKYIDLDNSRFEERPIINRRASTIHNQEVINEIAREIMAKYPRTQKTDLANEIAEIIKKENLLDKHLSFDTIRKIYLKNHPNY